MDTTRKAKSNERLERRYPEGFWDKGDEYLKQCMILQHNADYLNFLVKHVWRLDQACRLAEFGCGSGKIGLALMPLLAPGSTYLGIDQSAQLINRGRQYFAGTPWKAEFIEGSVYNSTLADQSYDVTLTHTVLMHIPHPEDVINEMIRVTKPNGMVIACEANRNAHTAMLHIEEVNHQESVPLELFQTINSQIRRTTGVDHNIGAKLPILMHRAGLGDIQIRVSDAGRFLFPPVNSVKKRQLFKAICDEGYGQPSPTLEQRNQWVQNLVKRGVSQEAAEAEIDREIDEDFLNKGRHYHTVYFSLLTWCFGYVRKQR